MVTLEEMSSLVHVVFPVRRAAALGTTTDKERTIADVINRTEVRSQEGVAVGSGAVEETSTAPH